MPRIIPQTIKIQIIREWLAGIPRDTIARNCQTGAGTVTGIIQGVKNDIPDIDLLREAALIIKKRNLDLNYFASSIRLKKRLDRLELPEENIESFIEEINVHCFKNGLKNKEFIFKIDEVSRISNTIGISIYDIPLYINEKINQLKIHDNEILKKQEQIRQLIQDYNRTEKDLQEYRLRQPVFDKLFELGVKLEEKDKEIIQLKAKLEEKDKEINRLKDL